MVRTSVANTAAAFSESDKRIRRQRNDAHLRDTFYRFWFVGSIPDRSFPGLGFSRNVSPDAQARHERSSLKACPIFRTLGNEGSRKCCWGGILASRLGLGEERGPTFVWGSANRVGGESAVVEGIACGIEASLARSPCGRFGCRIA